MRKNIIISVSLSLLFVVIVGSIIALPSIFKDKSKWHVQSLDYSETLDVILNPDQGFYKPVNIKLTTDFSLNASNLLDVDYQLYHLRMDIGAFSQKVNGESDIELTTDCLNGIDSLLRTYLNAEKNVIIRFAYVFEREYNKEASEEYIFKHIEQLCPILNRYPLTITAIEAGMVGPWGEMHSSDIVSPEIISKIIDKFLKSTDDIPILVRTPKMIYDYLGIDINDLDSYDIDKSSLVSRLGLFNDGYLASDTDLGTYTNREKEIEWLSNQLYNLPFGGEVTGSNSNLHDITKCLPEMFKMNLSYLNYNWNYDITQDKWQKQKYTSKCGEDKLYYGKTAFEYIKNHLGYRLVLKKSKLYYNEKLNNLKGKLELKNVGFGNFYRTKNIDIYFVKDDKLALTYSVGKYNGEDVIEYDLDVSMLNGEYQIYIGINSKDNGKTVYPIKFANNLYNENLRANLIGKISIKRS